ncbi:hypothetical protein BASA83_005354 [Batrachochytrium salamandrivorans]|nr:hypothetical protein BASA83_005354 [Batrachochytrium salamandrivorans]
MWRQCRFNVTSLCHGLLLVYSWLEKHNPGLIGFSRMVDFDSPYCLETVRLGQLGLRDLENSQQRQNYASEPRINGALRSDASDLEKMYFLVLLSMWNLDSIHSDVYPFLDASPESKLGGTLTYI